VFGAVTGALALGAGAVLVALVACGLRRWRVAASAAGSAAALAGLVWLIPLAGLFVRPQEVDPAMRATLLAAGISEAVSCGVLALGIALLSATVWFIARRRLRETPLHPKVEAFLSRRKQLLKSANPELAFAADPARGAQALPGASNEAAYELLRQGTSLRRLHDGAEIASAGFDRLLFVEAWDVLSASARGSHMKPFEDGLLGSFGIVFVTTTPQPPERAKSDWYWPVAFELVEGHPLRDAIAVIPFVAVRGAGGTLTFHEGLEGCRYRGGAGA
jgi:hypothetical protein